MSLLPSSRALLVLGLLAAPTAALQEPSSAPAEASATLPSAEEVLGRWRETAGADAVAKAKALHTTGTVEIVGMGVEGTFEEHRARPDKSLLVMDLGAMGETRVGHVDGVAWMTHPMIGARVLDGTEALQARNEAQFASFLRPAEQYASQEVVGRETFEERDAWKVELVARPDEGMDAEETKAVRTSHDFYDVETGHLIGTVATSDSPFGRMETTVVHEGWEERAGVLVPTAMTIRQPMAEVRLVVTGFELAEEAADPAVFTPPDAIRALLEEDEAAAEAPAEDAGDDGDEGAGGERG